MLVNDIKVIEDTKVINNSLVTAYNFGYVFTDNLTPSAKIYILANVKDKIVFITPFGYKEIEEYSAPSFWFEYPKVIFLNLLTNMDNNRMEFYRKFKDIDEVLNLGFYNPVSKTLNLKKLKDRSK